MIAAAYGWFNSLRTEDMDRVWQSALANMELYLTVRDRSRAFRTDCEVQQALDASGVGSLSLPTLDEGETYEQLVTDRAAFEDFDLDAARTMG